MTKVSNKYMVSPVMNYNITHETEIVTLSKLGNFKFDEQISTKRYPVFADNIKLIAKGDLVLVKFRPGLCLCIVQECLGLTDEYNQHEPFMGPRILSIIPRSTIDIYIADEREKMTDKEKERERSRHIEFEQSVKPIVRAMYNHLKNEQYTNADHMGMSINPETGKFTIIRKSALTKVPVPVEVEALRAEIDALAEKCNLVRTALDTACNFACKNDMHWHDVIKKALA